MKFDDIQNQSKKDLSIEPDKLDAESLKTPDIHHKYMRLLAQEASMLKRHKLEMKKLRRRLWVFYSGRATDAEYAAKPEFDPNQKILRQDLNMWIEGDSEFYNLQEKISLTETKVEFLQGVIDRINKRGFDIKNAIDFLKFKNGG